mgnify:CR=1 FL=1
MTFLKRHGGGCEAALCRLVTVSDLSGDIGVVLSVVPCLPE